MTAFCHGDSCIPGLGEVVAGSESIRPSLAVWGWGIRAGNDITDRLWRVNWNSHMLKQGAFGFIRPTCSSYI